jgi:toxin FitB
MAAAQKARKTALIVLDSSCWLEYLAETQYASRFDSAIAHPDNLVVPIITIYEVMKKTARERGDEMATTALSLMQQGRIVELNLDLTLVASTYTLPLADSLIYATAQAHYATLWTQDAHFDGLPGVKYFPKT